MSAETEPAILPSQFQFKRFNFPACGTCTPAVADVLDELEQAFLLAIENARLQLWIQPLEESDKEFQSHRDLVVKATPRFSVEPEPSTPENVARRRDVSYDSQSPPRTPERGAANKRPTLRPAFTAGQRAGTPERRLENQVRRGHSCSQSGGCAQSPTQAFSPEGEEPPSNNLPDLQLMETDVPTMNQTVQPTASSNEQTPVPLPDIPGATDKGNSDPVVNEIEAEVVAQHDEPQIQFNQEEPPPEPSQFAQTLEKPSENVQPSASPQAEVEVEVTIPQIIQPPDAALEEQILALPVPTGTSDVEPTPIHLDTEKDTVIEEQNSTPEAPAHPSASPDETDETTPSIEQPTAAIDSEAIDPPSPLTPPPEIDYNTSTIQQHISHRSASPTEMSDLSSISDLDQGLQPLDGLQPGGSSISAPLRSGPAAAARALKRGAKQLPADHRPRKSMRISLSEAGRRPVQPTEGSTEVVLKSQLKKKRKSEAAAAAAVTVKAAVVQWPPRKGRVGFKNWVECTRCEGWYHFGCVGIAQMPKKNFECPQCEARAIAPRSQRGSEDCKRPDCDVKSKKSEYMIWKET